MSCANRWRERRGLIDQASGAGESGAGTDVAVEASDIVLAREGLLLHPAVGAFFMSASTVIDAMNAQLLRRV